MLGYMSDLNIGIIAWDGGVDSDTVVLFASSLVSCGGIGG